MEIIVETQDVGVPEEKTDYIVRQPLDCVSKTKPKKFKSQCVHSIRSKFVSTQAEEDESAFKRTLIYTENSSTNKNM